MYLISRPSSKTKEKNEDFPFKIFFYKKDMRIFIHTLMSSSWVLNVTPLGRKLRIIKVKMYKNTNDAQVEAL